MNKQAQPHGAPFGKESSDSGKEFDGQPWDRGSVSPEEEVSPLKHELLFSEPVQREFPKPGVSPHQPLPLRLRCHLWLPLKALSDPAPARPQPHLSQPCLSIQGTVITATCLPSLPFTANSASTPISLASTFSF